LGPGPWKVLTRRKRGLRWRENNFGYRLTPNAHPRHIYDDILVGIFPERLLNNGLPSGLAMWFDNLELKRAERVVHIGCGTGYYSAILAQVVGPGGHVTAVEIDDELAPRAKANLAHLAHVEVVQGDGSAFDFSNADAVFINAGATHVPVRWIDSLPVGARLIFPLISTNATMPMWFSRSGGQIRTRAVKWHARMAGVMLRVWRREHGYEVTPVSTVGIFPCIGAIDREADAAIARALAAGGFESIKSLRRDNHTADESCWLHANDLCLSKLELRSTTETA
jgi:protein-L-isoaspartate(D-aspartate) O-methyltransferase